MRRLVRTTDGAFLRDGAKTWALGKISDAEILEAVKPANLKIEAAITGDLLAPVSPTILMLMGMNFPSHSEEFGQPVPADPMMGPSSGTAVIRPGATVSRPEHAPDFVDYEGEVAIVIGKPCHNVSEVEAGEYVLGVTALIDLSLRDVLFRALLAMRSGKTSPTLGEAKTFPGAKPLGPELLLLDGADPRKLELDLKTHVNGKLKQTGNVREFIYSIPKIVSKASQLGPLEPGDLIGAGTPAGIGLVEGIFLEPGDKVAVTLGPLPPLEVTIA
jgi:acylpyruvate hydrolase